MQLFAIRRTSAWANMQDLEKAGAVSARVGDEDMPDSIRWIRSYIVREQDGRVGSVCIYEAKDEASIREHARRVGMPADQIWPIEETVVVRPDPVKTSPHLAG
jgi:hypothetical protein